MAKILDRQPGGLSIDEADTNNFILRHIKDHLEPTKMIVWQVGPVACSQGPPMNRPKNGSRIDE